jgi:hypothetical protein
MLTDSGVWTVSQSVLASNPCMGLIDICWLAGKNFCIVRRRAPNLTGERICRMAGGGVTVPCVYCFYCYHHHHHHHYLFCIYFFLFLFSKFLSTAFYVHGRPLRLWRVDSRTLGGIYIYTVPRVLCAFVKEVSRTAFTLYVLVSILGFNDVLLFWKRTIRHCIRITT